MERETVYLPKDLKERLGEFGEDRDINLSASLRRTADRGLVAYGYDDASTDASTRLEHASLELAKAAAIAAATVLVLVATGKLPFAVAQFTPPLFLASALALVVVYHEPDLTLRYGRGGDG